MPRNEDNEYELVLGNRQLLSIFFIVVVLLGAGFTMGYLLGRSSGPSSAMAGAPVPAKTAEELPALPLPDKKDVPAAVTPAPAPAAVEHKAKETPAPKTAAEPAKSRAFKSGAPPVGAWFVQVFATTKSDAEIEAANLSKQGFPTWVAPNEKNAEQYRVLVGPYKERTDVGKVKTDLEKLGFHKAFVKEIK